MHFDGKLEERIATADNKLTTLLEKIDQHIKDNDMTAPQSNGPLERVPIPKDPSQVICLEDEGIKTIIWATGYDRSYPFLTKFPSIFDERGNIIQSQGATSEAGIYVVGMRFQTRRDSNFVDGVRFDANTVVNHIASTTVRQHPS